LKFRIIELFGYQADFAQRAGVQESLVSRVVRGRRSISKEDQKKWGKILQQDVKNLFEGDTPNDGI
jgi:transcriptional regulator with XRE-family HTH domain